MNAGRMKVSIVLFILSFSLCSTAFEFKVGAEAFPRLFAQQVLPRFQLSAKRLADTRLSRIYEDSATFTFPIGKVPADCRNSVQNLDLETSIENASIRQVFTFTNCDGNISNLTLIRRGNGLRPITVADFLSGAWALPMEGGAWSLETSWNPLKIVYESTKEGHEVFIRLTYVDQNQMPRELEFVLKEVRKMEGSSEVHRREYSLTKGDGAGVVAFVVQKSSDDGYSSKEESFLNNEAINHSQFSQGYQRMILGALVQLTGMTLGMLPVR